MATTTAQPSQQNPYASASLYVGDLAPDVTEATLFELFNAVGPVASIRICPDATTRKSLGYAYVNFHSVQDAERALDTMNFSNIRARQCRIMWCQHDPGLRKNNKCNIFVRGLHKSIDSKALYDTFSLFGNILSCKVVTDPENGKSRGYGYVHFYDEKSAQKAIEGVNGMKIPEANDGDGSVVQAELFKSKEEREKNAKYTNIYVKYIPPKLDEKALIELFTKVTGGHINSSQYWIQPFGISACFNYDSYEHAKTAVEKMNGYDVSEFWGKIDEEDDEKNQEAKKNRNNDKLYVARAQKRSERSIILNRKNRRGRLDLTGPTQYGGANLYVKNLTPDIDDKKLHQMFSKFGEISSSKVMTDQNGRSRLFGFVAFKTKEDATRAMHEMQNTIVDGKPLYVARAQSKAFRQQYISKQIRNKRTRFPPQAIAGGYNAMRPQFGMYSGPQSQGYGGFPRIGGPFGQQQFPGAGGPQIMQPRPMGEYPVFAQNMPSGQIPGIAAPFQNVPTQQRQMFPQSAIPTLPFQVPQQISNFAQPNIMRAGPGVIQQPSTAMQSSSAQMYQSVPRNIPTSGGQQAVVAPPSGPTGSVHQTQPTSAPASQQSAPMLENQPLTTEMLKTAKPNERKRLIGERLFPKIQVVEPRLAGKITGMLLEMEDTELLILLDNSQALMSKINEALTVLREHQQRQSQSNRNPSSVNRQQGSSQTNTQAPTLTQSQSQAQQH